MRGVTFLLLLLLSAPAIAQSYNCEMDDARNVSFRIDIAMFVDAISAKEPIQRKVTQVALGEARFPAEPFVIGAMRGFSAEAQGGSTVMFVVTEDGVAALSDRQAGLKINGYCEVHQ